MSDRSGQPRWTTEALLHAFSELPGIHRDSVLRLRQVIGSSTLLNRQIDAAIERGVLRGMAGLDSASSAYGEYDPSDCVVRLQARTLAEPARTAFVLGHEVQHALNSPTIDQSTAHFYTSLRRASSTTLNYTAAIRNTIGANRWDEASATLVGWNVLVDFLRQPGQLLELRQILKSAPGVTAEFVDRASTRAQIDPALTPNSDLTFNLSPENIEAMARRFFDTPPRRSGLGDLGTFDYTNYYGAWAVGVAVEEHQRSHPGQLMRIDLARLGLSEKLLAQNGLELSVAQQRYVDRSTEPPTYGILRNTNADPKYLPLVPQTELPRHLETARLAATGVRRSVPGSTPARVRCAPVAHRARPTDPLGR